MPMADVTSFEEGRRKMARLAAIKQAETIERRNGVYLPRSIRTVVEHPATGEMHCVSACLITPDWVGDRFLGGEYV
jgi:hypothetical protein